MGFPTTALPRRCVLRSRCPDHPNSATTGPPRHPRNSDRAGAANGRFLASNLNPTTDGSTRPSPVVQAHVSHRFTVSLGLQAASRPARRTSSVVDQSARVNGAGDTGRGNAAVGFTIRSRRSLGRRWCGTGGEQANRAAGQSTGMSRCHLRSAVRSPPSIQPSVPAPGYSLSPQD